MLGIGLDFTRSSMLLAARDNRSEDMAASSRGVWVKLVFEVFVVKLTVNCPTEAGSPMKLLQELLACPLNQCSATETIIDFNRPDYLSRTAN